MRHNIRNGLYLHTRKGAKRPVWHMYMYVGGEEVQRSTKTTDLSEAIKIAEDAWRDAVSKKRRHQRVKTPTFKEVAEEYLKHITKRMKDGPKKRDLTRRVRRHLVPFAESQIGANAPMDKVIHIDFDAYPDWRQDVRDREIDLKKANLKEREAELRAKWTSSSRVRKWSPDIDEYVAKHMPRSKTGLGFIREEVSATTIRYEYADARAIFKFACKQRYITKYDVPDIEAIPTDDRTRVGFSWDEVQQLREVADRRFLYAAKEAGRKFEERSDYKGKPGQAWRSVWHMDRVSYSRWRAKMAIDLIAATGMRPSTLCGLRRGHVVKNPKGMPTLLINDSVFPKSLPGPQYAFLARTRKGRRGAVKERYIVGEEWSWKSISQLLQHTPKAADALLFEITSHALGKAVKNVIVEAGLDFDADGIERSIYDLRHAYITRKLLKGISVAVVAENTLTSVQMIEAHYNHISSLQNFNLLAGRPGVSGRHQTD